MKSYIVGLALVAATLPALGQNRLKPETQQTPGGSATISKLARTPGPRFAPELGGTLFPLPATIKPSANLAPSENVSAMVSGYVAATPAGLTAPEWQTAADGSAVAVIELVSPGAVALRAQFRESFGRDGLELRVFDPVSGVAFGPYTRPVLNEEGEWWTTIIFGQSIGLEFHMPAGEFQPGRIPPVTAINYIYEQPPVIVPRACTLNDVTCSPNWSFEADAVCVLATVSGGNVSTFCSGSLMWRQPNDACPLVQTANHCLGSQSAAGNTSYVWFFQTSVCNGAPPNINTCPRSDGSLLLKRYTDADWNLVGLYEPPASGNYLGWTTADWNDGDTAVGISHPSGTFKKIAFGSKTGDGTYTFCDSGGNNCFDADEWNVSWSNGEVLPGSSGSPVMDGSGLIRGALSGGPTNDCTVARYGRFDEAYTNLRYYMGNADIASPVIVNVAVPGDSGNNGNVEQGTAPFPFNTAQEGTYAVRAGDTVQIVPGHYNERFTIWRQMTLARYGNSGSVLLGTP